MTSDGVDGTAGDHSPGVGSGDRAPGSSFIKHDDEPLARRYIDLPCPHVAAGSPPDRTRRQLQVAAALRDSTIPVIASPACATGTIGRGTTGARAKGCR